MHRPQWLAIAVSVAIHALVWLSLSAAPTDSANEDNVIAFSYHEGAPQASSAKANSRRPKVNRKASAPTPRQDGDLAAFVAQAPAASKEDGETTLEEADFGRAPNSPEEQYLADIRKQVLSAQAYPKASRFLKEEGVVKIRLTLLRDGSLQMIELIGPSAFKRLNDAAVHAASHSTPFPAFPAQVPYQVWKIVLPIRFKLEAS